MIIEIFLFYFFDYLFFRNLIKKRMHIWLRSEPLNSCANNYPISHHINANVSEYMYK
jgi:hypothetical protein